MFIMCVCVCLCVLPGSMNPARQENMPTGKIFFLPSKHWFPSGWITSMMTTGSGNIHGTEEEDFIILTFSSAGDV